MTISKKPSSSQSPGAFFLDKAHFYPGSNFRMSDKILEQYFKQLIGMDLGSPVSLDYHERSPFKFYGKIKKVNIKCI